MKLRQATVGLCWTALGGILLALQAGCHSKSDAVAAPQGAPHLYQGQREFHDDQQGFRFTPPSGWGMQARAVEAPGAPAGERPLVKYKRLVPGKTPAWLKVSVTDASSSTPLADLLGKRSPGPHWKQASAAESLEVSGLPAARISFAGKYDNRDFIREILAVRRGHQVFFFAATFPAGDPGARDLMRQAVDSAIWEQRDADR